MKVPAEQAIKTQVDNIEQRYNGDNDTVPGAPAVTWADRELLEVCKKLARKVDELQLEVEYLTDELRRHQKSPYLH